jgi:hypothetical protein
VIPGRRATARFTGFYGDFTVGMLYLVKIELTARAMDIKPIAKAFSLIEFHFFSP